MDLQCVKEFNGVNFVYKIPSIDLVTRDFIAGTKWPEKAKAVIFQFDSVKEDAHEVLWKNIDGKYFSRLYYYAAKADLVAYKDCASADSITKYKFKNHQEMEDVYIRTIAEHFWKPWGENVFKFSGRERSEKIIASQAKDDLKENQVLSHVKNGEVVSFLAHTPVHEPVVDEEVDWILWLWMRSDLNVEEKRHIKRDFTEFLRNNNGNKRIVAPTEPFNFKPNVFWQKMGFKLGCVGLTIK